MPSCGKAELVAQIDGGIWSDGTNDINDVFAEGPTIIRFTGDFRRETRLMTHVKELGTGLLLMVC